MGRLFSRITFLNVVAFLVVCTMYMQPASANADLTMWHCWGAARHGDIEAQAKVFAEKHDVNIEVLNLSCANIFERFQVAYVANIAPDIIMVHSTLLPTAALHGFITDLTTHIDRTGLSADDFIPSDFEASTWDGRFYGMPIRTGADENTLIYYSTDAFDEAGLDVDSPPQTWSELVDLGRKLVVYDGPNLRRTAINLERTISDFSMAGWLYSGGGQLVSDDGTRVTVADEPGREAMFEFKEMYDVLSHGRVSTGTTVEAEFVYGHNAMMIGGGRAFEIIKRADPDFDFRIAIKPHRDDSPPISGVHVGTWHYAISSTASNPKLAWDLLEWLTTQEETVGQFLFNQGRPSALLKFNQNVDYLYINPDFLVIYEAMQRATSLPFVPGVRDVMDEFERTARSMLLGIIAPGPGLESFASTQQPLLEESMRHLGL